MNRRALFLVWVALVGLTGVAHAGEHPTAAKLDAALWARSQAAAASVHRIAPISRVIVRTSDGLPATDLILAAGGRPGRYFPTFGGQVAALPDNGLEWLASHPDVEGLSLDRAVYGTYQRSPSNGSLDRTDIRASARWIAEQFGIDGSGIGVATIDSGVSGWHDDLDGRVVHFADFVDAQTVPYDDYGHGTHVAGIIAGSGLDSAGERRGMSPGAHLVVLKALDVRGNGYTSNVIAAIDYAIANRATYNLRVMNLSVAAGVYESVWKDPLTLAAKRAVDAGIVVVAAAGNHGRGPNGRAQYGAIASPGNAPWVLTIGAAHDRGTLDRRDDTVATFSSRGPAAIDGNAKPDLIAPGVGIDSTTDAGSALFAANPRSRLWGSTPTPNEPYLSLTGTSMAAPVVTGIVALMLHANPTLTPNAVKAILQYTAETRPGYDYLTQGAGFLNARGAVELARTFAGIAGTPSAASAQWNRHIIWGNVRLGGSRLVPGASAWRLGVTWGDVDTPAGEAVGAGTDAPACDVVAGTCDGARR